VCRNIFKNWSPDRVTARVALIALLVSMVSVVITAYYAHDTQHLENEGQVNQMMLTYLVKIDDCMKGPCKVGFRSLDEFKRLPNTDQTTVTIVAGLLILVVDSMYKAEDPRADRWKGYLTNIPGPLRGYPEIESYASDERTIKAIRLVIASNK
jgi:hypothetical protein